MHQATWKDRTKGKRAQAWMVRSMEKFRTVQRTETMLHHPKTLLRNPDVTMNEVRLRSERTIFKLGSSETERTSRNG